jgi:hypothetical protein
VSDEGVLLVGYNLGKRHYFLQGFVACVAVCVVAFVWPKLLPQKAVPLLFASACLLGELWWRSKYPLHLVDIGFKCGEELIPWEQVSRCTSWGPFGIPWTPLKFQGINIYLKNEQSFSVYSNAPGFSKLQERIQTRQQAPLAEPVWYRYPSRPLRFMRYVVAFLFALIYMVLLAVVELVLIIGLVVGGYFLYQWGNKLYHAHNKKLPEKVWFIAIGTIAGGGLLVLAIYLLTFVPVISSILGFFKTFFIYLFSLLSHLLDWLPLLAGFIPVFLVLWFPWKPDPVTVMNDALFLGETKAYPLRHLRSERMSSKFLVFKLWELVFANGSIALYPLLEDFEPFKKKLQTQWDEVQKRYFGKPIPEEEAKIRTPQEEAQIIMRKST